MQDIGKDKRTNYLTYLRLPSKQGALPAIGGRQFKSGPGNQNFFPFNNFRKPRNHPNLYAAVEIRESCV